MTTEERVLFCLLLGLYPVLVWLMFWGPKKYLIYRLVGSYTFLKYREPMEGYQFFETWPMKTLEKPLIFLEKLLIDQMTYVFLGLQVYGFLMFLFIKIFLGIDSIHGESTWYFTVKLQFAIAIIVGHYHRCRLLDYQDQAEAKYLINQAKGLLKMVKEDPDEEEDDYWWKTSED